MKKSKAKKPVEKKKKSDFEKWMDEQRRIDSEIHELFIRNPSDPRIDAYGSTAVTRYFIKHAND